MSFTQMRDVSQAILPSITEEELAHWYREQGTHVIYHQGRYWKQTVLGFYEPLHWMARLNAQQATCPTQFCWGFRAVLCEADAAFANGSIPIYSLSNLETYDLQSLTSKRRNQLRKCRKQVKIVPLTESALLQEQGYEVVFSALTRTAYTKPPSKADYLAKLADYVAPERRLILAGLIGDQLGGYITGYAVSEIAYIEDLIVATEALSTDIGSGLQFEFAQICRRSGTIRELVHGLHSREDRGLCFFKEGMGFQVNHIPAKVQVNPIIEKVIHWRYPHKYYRLTGHD